jgi:hypothetical protein
VGKTWVLGWLVVIFSDFMFSTLPVLSGEAEPLSLRAAVVTNAKLGTTASGLFRDMFKAVLPLLILVRLVLVLVAGNSSADKSTPPEPTFCR